MLPSTKYELMVQAIPSYDLLGQEITDYQFMLKWDEQILRSGTVSSPQALGRAIGDGLRDAAEKYERNFKH